MSEPMRDLTAWQADQAAAQDKACYQTPELHQLCQLIHGPVWDGNLMSKSARDDLVKSGLVLRVAGWNVLSVEGVKTLYNIGFLRA